MSEARSLQADAPSGAPPCVQPSYEIRGQACQTAPMLVASAHSGRAYPPEFVAASRLGFNALRRSEDSFVDEMFGDAPAAGIPLLRAEFPRAYCDANREPWELDQAMFRDTLPAWCNTGSARVLAGFGTIARLVASGQPIYQDKLSFTDAEYRIRNHWQPYHDALAKMIAATIAEHGVCLLIDAHSMPSPRGLQSGSKPAPEFVLGDAFGTSCAKTVTQFTERFLHKHGFRVRRNDPYAGGYVTRHYGRPSVRTHVLQIEICRGLYLDEDSFEKLSRFDEIRSVMRSLLAELARALPDLLHHD